MDFRNRVKELRHVPASELHRNPKNWRTHPKSQIQAIEAILREVGFAGAELARELPDGTLELIDGHARADIAGDTVVPVLVLDVNESEADKILATFDPIGALAQASATKLDALLRSIQTSEESLGKLLTDLAESNNLMDKWESDIDVMDKIKPKDSIVKGTLSIKFLEADREFITTEVQRMVDDWKIDGVEIV